MLVRQSLWRSTIWVTVPPRMGGISHRCFVSGFNMEVRLRRIKSGRRQDFYFPEYSCKGSNLSQVFISRLNINSCFCMLHEAEVCGAHLNLKPVKLPLPTIVVLGAFIGIAIGVGVYTFVYAKGYSYLTNDPAACANCHVMNEQYSGWIASSHRSVAVCNDCHTPSGIIPKYLTKAENGFRHSFAFTTGRFTEPIRITDHDREITNMACRKCHEEITQAIEGPHASTEPMMCLTCHQRVGHL